MSKCIFLDANIVLDLVLQRFVEDARNVFELGNKENTKLYASALTFAHVAYFAKRFGKDPYSIIKNLLQWINVVDCKKSHFEKNLIAIFSDFEDGLQYFSAVDVMEIDAIITRNKKDFKKSEIPVYTPSEFLMLYSS